MVDIQTISIAVASAGVFIAAVYYIFQLRHQSRMRQTEIETRQTDLIMRVYSAFGSEEFMKAITRTVKMEFKDYDEFVKKYSSPTGFFDTPEMLALGTVDVVFEEIGVLLHRKIIDRELVDDLFGYIAIVVWEKIKPIVEGWRKMTPRTLRQFEYLYNEMRKTQRYQEWLTYKRSQ